mmetsp:Transcript_62991/g.136766  ORF Transcript_62991/g.136766 Transcript_62991/m.136766 type:complete len:790 (+) Transcript_62991:114-2483(+)
MGCCGSTKQYHELLAEVQSKCKEHPSGVGDEQLDVMKSCADELCKAFVMVVQTKGSDADAFTSIERLSEAVLSNLDSRITPELLKRDPADFKRVEEQIMQIGTKLNSVRASKATARLESHFDRLRTQHTDSRIKEIGPQLDAIKSPEQLLTGALPVVVLLDEACSGAPSSKSTVAMTLFKMCSALGAKTLSSLAALMRQDMDNVGALRKLAADLDAVAAKVSDAGETPWVPVLPRVNDMLRQTVVNICTKHKDMDSLLALSDLQRILVLWQNAADLEGCQAQIKELVEASPSRALEALRAAIETGDEETCKTLREYGSGFDDLCSKYDGLRDPGASLASTLATEYSSFKVSRHVASLEEQLAGGEAKDTTQLLQALESIASAWDASRAEDEALCGRLAAACDAVESWALTTAADAKAGYKGALQDFAECYDQVVGKLSLPPEHQPLLPRIIPHVASTWLARAEEELAATGRTKPPVILEALRIVISLEPTSDRSDEVKQRLSAVISETVNRVKASCSESLKAEDSAKQDALLKFAGEFDLVCREFLDAEAGLEGHSPPTLVRELELLKERQVATTHVEVIEAEIAKEPGMDPRILVKRFEDLRSSVGIFEKEDELVLRLREVFSSLRLRVAKSCREAAGEDHVKKLELIVDFAKKFEGLQADLGDLSPGFLASIAAAGADADLTDAETELAKDSGMDPKKVLLSVSNLKLYFPLLPDLEEGGAEMPRRLGLVCAAVRRRIGESYGKVLEPLDERRRNELRQFAGLFDSAISGLAGACPPDLRAELEERG